jgi:outer membrane protein insertion porin family
MYPTPIHRRTFRSRRVATSPLTLVGLLPLSALAARADAPDKATTPDKPRVLLAQRRQEDRNAPAASPNDRPRGLQLPTGPIVGPPPTTPDNKGEGQNNSTTLSPGTNTPDAPPSDTQSIIGPVAESEGREIAEVRVVGNRITPSEAIIAQVRTQRASAFASRQVELDRARIDALGFFATVQAQVAPDVNDPQKVVVTYIVVENRVVTGFRFVGNTLVKAEDLQKAVSSKVGVLLNVTTVRADVDAIQKAYTEKGFAVLVPGGGINQEDNGQLVFTLHEARVTEIRLEGLKKTRPGLVRRLIQTRKGMPFDYSKIRRDLSRIYDTGFFEDAVPDTNDDPNAPGDVIVTYRLKEARSGNFNVGLGFDSRSKVSGFVTLGENNLGGSGKRASASVEAGSQRNYDLSFGNPFVGQKLGSYDLSIYSRTLFRDPSIFQNLAPTVVSNTNFVERRQGGRINYAQPLDQDRNNTVLFGYRNERARLSTTDISGNTVDNPLLADFSRPGTVSAASVGFLRDKRDSRLEPTRGAREQITLEQSAKLLGGTSTFTKLDLDLRRYLPLSKPKSATELPKIVLAGRVVVGRSLNQLPAFEQYFLGGPDTVRGYNTDSQFGDNQFYGNVELRYRFNRQIQGVLFSDAGSSFGGQFTSNKSADVLTSFGLGLRLQTPIGQVRLDYGIGRDGGRTHFAIGPTF